jgi:NAD(P)-dependent dehydrogenase (short-subunit alcohol dehydrogenase family)
MRLKTEPQRTQRKNAKGTEFRRQFFHLCYLFSTFAISAVEIEPQRAQRKNAKVSEFRGQFFSSVISAQPLRSLRLSFPSAVKLNLNNSDTFFLSFKCLLINKISLKEKICVITGANSGIGKETAKALAKMGFTIVMVCRNFERGKQALEEIKSFSGSDKVELLIADLSQISEIKRLANAVAIRYEHIDVLINNAGVFNMHRHTTVDGLEMTFAVNYIAPFLLTNLLLPQLKAAAQGRIIIVSSKMEILGKLELDDLNFEKRPYNMIRSYSDSKLMTILYTKELARRLSGTNVTINAVHPGGVATNLGMEKGNWLFKTVWKFGSLFFISSEKGAETSVYLASSPEVANVSGKFFSNKKPMKNNKQADNEASANRLLERTEEIVNAHA